MSRRTLGIVFGGLAAILAVALLIVTILGEGERGGGHDAGEMESAPAAPNRQTANAQVRFTLGVEPAEPAVGEVVTLSGRLVDAQTGQPVRNVRYEVTGQHLEDDVALFTARFSSLDGTFTWGYHFWDGVEYELRINVAPQPDSSVQFSPLFFRGPLDVTPVAPPVFIQLRSLFYLVAITGLGLVAGLWLSTLRRARPSIARSAAA